MSLSCRAVLAASDPETLDIQRSGRTADLVLPEVVSLQMRGAQRVTELRQESS